MTSLWHIDHVEAQRVELDLTSSERGGHSTVTSVRAEGIPLFNAVEVVEYDPALTQVEICDHCLFVGCNGGGWVGFRRVGSRVVWISAWNEMEKGEFEAGNYSPPSFVHGRGVPLFSADAWEEVRAIRSDLPAADALHPLSSREAARLCQWSASARVLGEFPDEPRVRRDKLVTVMQGDLEAEPDALDRCLHAHFVAVHAMDVLAPHAERSVVEFWLDLPGSAGWISSARVRGKMCLLLEGDIVLVATNAP